MPCWREGTAKEIPAPGPLEDSGWMGLSRGRIRGVMAAWPAQKPHPKGQQNSVSSPGRDGGQVKAAMPWAPKLRLRCRGREACGSQPRIRPHC